MKKRRAIVASGMFYVIIWAVFLFLEMDVLELQPKVEHPVLATIFMTICVASQFIRWTDRVYQWYLKDDSEDGKGKEGENKNEL